MKYSLFIVLLIITSTNFQSFGQKKDSLYIKINDLNPKIVSILLSGKGSTDDKGNISIISISMKNNYENVFRFGLSAYETIFFAKDRNTTIKQKKLISYKKLNELLDKDLVKTVINNDIFFILTMDKKNFYAIKVRPIIPNIQM